MRYWFIDVLRGLAVMGMVAFHTAFDLVLFGFASMELYVGSWLLFQRAIATIFIVVSGFSLAHSYARNPSFGKQAKGLVILFGASLLVTLATLVTFPHYAIYFGILHFLFACRLVALVLFSIFGRQNWRILFVIGLCCLALNWLIPFPSALEGSYIALPLGVVPDSFQSFDYYPFFPWSGLFFIGIGLGELSSRKLHAALARPRNALFDVFELMGKHALFIYLVHEVIVLFVIFSIAPFL